ncbi:hypothetical protein A2755_01160 [Candidatus Wolfebacteria bacterium RIFCSPHIGHO2_01_FULL_48_22]|uniref:Methyltransferase FkbM domain-containing protein n=2 Tax=Candidatus Wolfeibacteriota TaxID=1752735 RepID=A0A1F8DWJ6_9BACT|nr:MAG: hypothetical protein A2755_01160 [Candidatus Wolfebacteria bacterium RIFCSPHIGHO2_01_FULL_48_22]OGM93937.1 MAG: hypothetical protein A2935_03635 [Candidatus Wolfebacteria bacterium RIFCSPLOWO2_01_FULL_47_17b]
MHFLRRGALLVRVIRNISNWHIYLLDFFRLFPRGKRIVYRFRNGMKITVRGGMADRWILNEVVLRNTYFPPEFSLPDDSVMVDIGAHIGTFALLAAKKYPKGRVFACEPNPDNFAMLVENVRINGFHNLKAINKAVADTSGTRTFFINKDDSDRHTLVKDFAVHEHDSLTVETISMNDLMRDEHIERVDLLKIDCEGAEYEILNEKNGQFLDRTRQIIIEIHNLDAAHSKKDLIAWIEKKGFRVYGADKGVSYFIKSQ